MTVQHLTRFSLVTPIVPSGNIFSALWKHIFLNKNITPALSTRPKQCKT